MTILLTLVAFCTGGITIGNLAYRLGRAEERNTVRPPAIPRL